MIRIGTIYRIQNTCNVEVREIDPHGTHEKTVNFISMYSCCYGTPVSIRKKNGLYTANV